MTKRMLATLLSMIMFLIPLATSAIALATTMATAEFTIAVETVDPERTVIVKQDGAVQEASVLLENSMKVEGTEDGLKITEGNKETEITGTEDGIKITDGATNPKKSISNELLIEDLNDEGDNDDLAKDDPNKAAIDRENAGGDDIYIDNIPSSGSGTTVVTGSPSDVDKFKNKSGESVTDQVTSGQLDGATTDADTLEKVKNTKLKELNETKRQLEYEAFASATTEDQSLLKDADTTTASKTDIINKYLSDADKKQYKDVNYTIDMVSSASSTSILLNSGISIETDKSGSWTTLDGKDALLMTVTARAFGSSKLLTINEHNEIVADVEGVKDIILNIDATCSMGDDDSIGPGKTRWSVLCDAVKML